MLRTKEKSFEGPRFYFQDFENCLTSKLEREEHFILQNKLFT